LNEVSTQAIETPTAPHDPWASPPKIPLERKELRALQKRSDGPALRFLVGHIAVGLLTATLIYLSLGNIFLLVPAMFLHGVVIVFLFAPMHECTHGTAFRRRWVNSAVGYFCGFMLLRSSLYFKYRHADHHTYTQDPERDPDLVPIPGNKRNYISEVMGASLWPKLVGALYRSATGRFNELEQRFIPESERGRVAKENRILIGLYVAIAAVSIPTGLWQEVLLFWIVPRVLAEPVLRLVRLAEHTGMEEGPDPLSNTRTTLTNRVIRFLYWNMPYHAAHHMAPSVPFHALSKLHAKLPEHPVEAGYVRVHRGLVKNLGTGAPLPRIDNDFV
jgi:fatty acid desaturase